MFPSEFNPERAARQRFLQREADLREAPVLGTPEIVLVDSFVQLTISVMEQRTAIELQKYLLRTLKLQTGGVHIEGATKRTVVVRIPHLSIPKAKSVVEKALRAF